MQTIRRSPILLPLRRAVLLRDGAGLSDGQLLESFVERDDEAAFEALVRRHGPMVLGVCRRVLGCAQDAEDAFQATFLVLARKAACVAPRDLVGNWLHGVARRTALCARAGNRRRRAREKQVKAMPQPTTEPEAARREVEALVDQELSRLPVLYRAPVVLCVLEGRSRKEVARHLEVPEGTLSSRLATARRLLAARLARRGLALSGGPLAAMLSMKTAQAAPGLVASTVKAATAFAAGRAAAGVVSAKVVALAGGVLKTMSATKLTIATLVVLAATALGTGAGWFGHQALADKPADKAARDEGRERTEVRGVLKEVDARKGALTLHPGKGLTQEKVFRLAPDARIFLDDGTGDRLGFREGKAADLTAGTSVILRLAAGGKVVRLWAEGPTVQGVLESADAPRGTITATVEPSKGKPAEARTFPVAKAAKVFLDDGKGKEAGSKEKGLADLPAGAVVFLTLSADRKVVGAIRAEGQTLTGVVKAVDAGKGTISLTVKVKGQPEEDKTFKVAKEARVSIDGGTKDKAGRSRLAGIPVGANVTLRLSPDQASAVALQAEGGGVYGEVTAVDARNNTITLREKVAGKKTYPVSKNAAVLLDDKGGRKLADVPVEASVQMKLLVDQKTAIEIRVFGPNEEGTVKGNAGKGSFTLSTKEGDTTYNVAKGARIVIEEKRAGKLTDLIDGTVARIRLSVDKSEVLEIRAEGPSFQGTVKAVDTDKGTITLTVGAKGGVGGEDKDFKLAKDTVVTGADHVPLKLADLKAETTVVLRLSLDQKAAARITVAGE
jgi:RNA polymerase sigma factor (sigma-70 family)